ncbi:hypothetical protein VTK73DRAFT_4810 [Phialemonium thermophilum]|uniref:Transcription initiation factor TFIID subunit 4 n=1 Tax=Phialemonium thermophilum TaxID=223376 RepID=A0ABR3XYN4_9PEZI
MPPQAFSPPQQSPSPASSQPGFSMPPNKRPRLSPTSPSQPASPYNPSPFATSPGPSAATPTSSTTTPPAPPNVSTTAPANYSIPYTNGNSTPTLHLPESQLSFSPTSPVPLAPAPTPGSVTTNAQYTNASLTPISAPATVGAMGPPSKPAEKPTKEYEYDATDSLAGTGIDIRAEEQALADYYAGNFGQDARTGFPSNPPGNRASFYGAQYLNQPAQPVDAKTQEELAAQAAEKAWSEAAHRLAVSRSHEIRDPFLGIAVLHRKFESVAKSHGLRLNLEMKNNAPYMGRMRAPHEFPEPKVTVSTKTGPDGALVTTVGSFLPHDAYLVDQLALLSIATKHRLREKLEDGLKVATTRQKTSHGEVPPEWADVAAPLNMAESRVAPLEDGFMAEKGDLTGSPTIPPKRLRDTLYEQAPSVHAKSASLNPLASAMREVGREARELEEARLRKRQRRLNPEVAAATSRATSAAPGTTGSVAPEPEARAPSKKELKRGAAAARLAEASSTATANQTLQHMIGGFGGRKKGKQYAWMTAGASGASTPSRVSTPGQESSGTSLAVAAAKVAENTRLTAEGRYRLGNWREDGDKGKGIQLRDWVTALELDGIDIKAIQEAYIKLDDVSK